MHIDFKITTWERVEVPFELEIKISKKIKSGQIFSSTGLYEEFTDELDPCEILPEVEQQLDPLYNEGSSTIEVWENEKIIWKNGK